MKTFAPIAALLFIIACQPEVPLREAPELHGKWEETYFVVMDTTTDALGDMNFDIFIVDSTNYEKKMRLKPVRLTYKPDGTFEGEHRNLKDSIFVRSTGEWEVRGDSLYFYQLAPDTFFATYEYRVSEDTLHLKGVIDWNRNGQRADKFKGTLKKID